MKCPKCGYEPTVEETRREIEQLQKQIDVTFGILTNLKADFAITNTIEGMKKIMEGFKIIQEGIKKSE